MPRYRYTEADIAEAVLNSASVADVMRALGIKPAGGSHFHISKRIRTLGLDTSHFTGQGHNKGKTFESKRRKPEQILIVRHALGTRERPHLLRRALIESGVPLLCKKCRTPNVWHGRPLVLHIDHVNGDSLDCRLENLQFLCPNCHSQTASYCRKLTARSMEQSPA